MVRLSVLLRSLRRSVIVGLQALVLIRRAGVFTWVDLLVNAIVMAACLGVLVGF